MNERIIDNIENPEMLEQLYRANKQDFVKSFSEISVNYSSDLVLFWKIRLETVNQKETSLFQKTDLLIVIFLSLITGLLVKLPQIFPVIKENFFYMRDLSLVVFNGIILYTFWQNRIFDFKKWLFYGVTVLVLALFVNFLPDIDSDSFKLTFIYTPLVLWCLFGLAFISFDIHSIQKRMAFIRFNGEFIIMTGLILLAGGLMTAITIGLFSAIDVSIEKFYLNYVVVFGCVAAPIVAIYLIRLYPTITNRIAPVIARVFTPLVLITLTVYLISLIFSSTKILGDRNFLILFNIMLLCVMAIIVFSVSELDLKKVRNFNVLILFFLDAMAIVINAIALYAIISRSLNGLTPNRTVVLVSNFLIFVNLILIARSLINSYFKGKDLDEVEKTVASYLPVYMIWTVLVIFALPFVFGMK